MIFPSFNKVHKPLVINIGLHKTGTTSLAAAMHMLGWNVWDGGDASRHSSDMDGLLDGNPGQWDYYGDGWKLRDQAAFLALRYPDAKFIATTREKEAWVTSLIMHKMGGRVGKIGKEPQTTPWFTDPINEKVMRGNYDENQELIRRFEENGSLDFLRLDLSEKNKWVTLCDFLGVKIYGPPDDWPSENKGWWR